MGVSQKVMGYHNKKQQRVLKNSIRKPVEDPEKGPWNGDLGYLVGEGRKKEGRERGHRADCLFIWLATLVVLLVPW